MIAPAQPKVAIHVKECPKCGAEHDRRQAYCKICHAAYVREWRKTHPLNAEQRRKDTARSYANVYKSRGNLKEQPCAVCGSKAEMHHDDYDKPLGVRWLCRDHHLALHRSASEQ